MRILTAVALSILGCAPNVDLDSSVHQLSDTQPAALAPMEVDVANSQTAQQSPPQLPSASPTDSSERLSDGRAGGQLDILDNPPADRTELLAAYADAVRDQPFQYGDVGAVLEALAVQGMQRIYPAPHHSVVSGIEYSDANGRTIGELDIVVFLTSTGDAVMISEVKLSGNLDRAAQKANSQIRRFREAITNQQVATLRHKSRKTIYRVANFENVLRYGKIGSRGATDHGFDWEVDLTRDEGDQLQQLLLKQSATQR